MSAERNKSIVQQFLDEAYNKGNLSVGDKWLAADCVLHFASTDIKGLEGWKQFATMFLTAFPNLHVSIEDIVAEEDKVVARWTAHGTHKGPFRDIAPTGKHVTWMGIAIYRFAGGKIGEIWGLNDALGLMQQLGVIPSE
jgi:steroid delta-isomerase-like uncharacterized protein